MPSVPEQRRLAAIMFTDMVGYSALSQSNESLALELLEEHRCIVRDILTRHGGREVKTTGDGFLIEYPSALAAVQGAVAIQHALHERNQAQPGGRHVRIRIGIHVGDVVMKDGDIHGDGVNITARIEPLAEPGGICVSEDVARQVRNKLEQPLTALPPAGLKHIELPVLVHRVGLPWLQNQPPAAARTSTSRHLPRLVAMIGTAIALVLLVAGVGRWIHAKRSPIGRSAGIHSVAVGLTSDSSDPEQQAWARMMTELLVSHLSRIQSLDVRQLPFSKADDATQVALAHGRSWGVQFVVCGTVHYTTNEVLIIPKLVEVANGRIRWADDSHRRRLGDILGLQQDLAADIARKISVTLSPTDQAGLARKATENPEALKAYLQGRASWLRGNEAGFSNAIVHFERAVALDPQYALAYAGLSDAYSAATSAQLPPTVGYPRCKKAAERALELSANLADAHTALGMAIMFDEWDWPKAEHHLKRAIELDPNLAQAHNAYCNFLAAANRLEESAREGLEAIRLNPLAASYRQDLGYTYLVKRDLTNAFAQFQAAEGLDPSNPMVHLNYGWIAMVNRDPVAAERAFREAQRLRSDDPLSLAGLGASLAAQGRRTEALAIVHQLDELGTTRFVPAGQAVTIYGHLGETGLAFARLEQALRQKENSVPWIQVDPGLIPIRPDPRFQELVQRVFAKR